jgi:NAD(P)-dependent dehydrogenase (short-subunit alcohol dehydrogenase family)
MSTSNSWTPAAIPDQSGRRVVITGATGGLGYHTALELARRSASVVLTVRAATKGEETAAAIRGEVPDADVSVLTCDLASLASVRTAAETAASSDRIDILINNAGVMAPPQRQTDDGFELQMGANHLGHFALTGLLMPVLSRSSAPRVVTVTSAMHRTVRRLDLSDPHKHGRYRKWTAYSQSKLANLLFARELDRRARAGGSSLVSVASHPGYASTHLQQSGPQMGGRRPGAMILIAVTAVVGQSAAVGAWPSLRAATDPEVPGGALVGPTRFGGSWGSPGTVGSSRVSGDVVLAARLWEWSEASDRRQASLLASVTTGGRSGMKTLVPNHPPFSDNPLSAPGSWQPGRLVPPEFVSCHSEGQPLLPSLSFGSYSSGGSMPSSWSRWSSRKSGARASWAINSSRSGGSGSSCHGAGQDPVGCSAGPTV